jgi:hypothetical protein
MNTQNLDFYHCQEHLFAFANKYHPKDANSSKKLTVTCIDGLIAKKVDEVLIMLKQLPCSGKDLKKEKERLYNYLVLLRKLILF